MQRATGPAPDSLVHHRDTCRLCEKTDVTCVLRLTPCPPVDAYIPEARLREPQPAFPLDLYRCERCGHFQLLDVVAPELLFGSYIYTTSSSPGLLQHFRAYADDVLKFTGAPSGGLAVDIGSNDGTLLRFFRDRGLRVLGIDPARDIAAVATAGGLETLPAFFTSALAAKLRGERGPCALVTANNVFAHADDLGDMAEGVRTLLAPDGVFVCEVSYMLDMIENMVFDFIYHEHLSHHSVKPLQQFLRRHGLELLHVERNASKGGSLRCFAQPVNGPRPVRPSVGEMLALEERLRLYAPETCAAYAQRIAAAKAAVEKVVGDLRAGGQRIAGYGASATATVLTYHFNLGPVLDCILDDNPVRQNLFSPGFHIPVRPSSVLYEAKPDAVIILAWRFADMMMQKHRAYRDQGGRFLVPLPELRLL